MDWWSSLVTAAAAIFVSVLFIRSRVRARHAAQGLPIPISTIARLLDRAWCRLYGETMCILDVPLMCLDETVVLNGIVFEHTRYFPAGYNNLPLPCILMRTPYGREMLALVGWRFASRGYCCIAQDCQGRGGKLLIANDASAGDEKEFIPFVKETADGIATLEWLAKQQFCNGAVGMYGMSYMGIVQLAVLDDKPQCLKAIVPVNAASNIHSAIYHSPGSLHIDLIIRWLYLIFVVQAESFLPWRLYRRTRLRHTASLVGDFLPMERMDQKILGRDLGFFKGAIRNPDPSHEFWLTGGMRSVACDHIERAPPALLMTGVHDIFLRPQLDDWQILQDVPGAQHTLIVGPWHHWEFGTFSKTVMRDALEWLDLHLKPDGKSLTCAPPRVRVFVNGDGWIPMERFPPATIPLVLYLAADGHLVPHAPPVPSALQYAFDPLDDPTPCVGGRSFDPQNTGARSQNAFEKRADVLVFSSQPFEQDTTVIGRVHVIMYGQSSAPSSDWVARLCYVDRSGSSINLCDGVVRIAPSETSTGVNRIDIDLLICSHTFKTGQCARVHICSGGHPRFSRNSGTGQCPSAEAHQFHLADKVVHMGADRASHIILPVYAQ